MYVDVEHFVVTQTLSVVLYIVLELQVKFA